MFFVTLTVPEADASKKQLQQPEAEASKKKFDSDQVKITDCTCALPS